MTETTTRHVHVGLVEKVTSPLASRVLLETEHLVNLGIDVAARVPLLSRAAPLLSKVLIMTVSVLESTYTSGQSALATASARKDEALNAVSARKQAAVEQIKSIADTNPVVKAGRAVVHQGVEKFDHLVTASKAKLQEYPAVQTGLDRIETAYETGKEKLAQSKSIVRDSIEQGRAKLQEREQKVRGIVHRIREDVTETVKSVQAAASTPAFFLLDIADALLDRALAEQQQQQAQDDTVTERRTARHDFITPAAATETGVTSPPSPTAPTGAPQSLRGRVGTLWRKMVGGVRVSVRRRFRRWAPAGSRLRRAMDASDRLMRRVTPRVQAARKFVSEATTVAVTPAQWVPTAGRVMRWSAAQAADVSDHYAPAFVSQWVHRVTDRLLTDSDKRPASKASAGTQTPPRQSRQSEYGGQGQAEGGQLAAEATTAAALGEKVSNVSTAHAAPHVSARDTTRFEEHSGSEEISHETSAAAHEEHADESAETPAGGHVKQQHVRRRSGRHHPHQPQPRSVWRNPDEQ